MGTFDSKMDRDNADYAKGVEDGLSGDWLDDQAQSLTNFQDTPYDKGYEWGQTQRSEHRAAQQNREAADRDVHVDAVDNETKATTSSSSGSSGYSSTSGSANSGSGSYNGVLFLTFAAGLGFSIYSFCKSSPGSTPAPSINQSPQLAAPATAYLRDRESSGEVVPAEEPKPIFRPGKITFKPLLTYRQTEGIETHPVTVQPGQAEGVRAEPSRTNGAGVQGEPVEGKTTGAAKTDGRATKPAATSARSPVSREIIERDAGSDQPSSKSPKGRTTGGRTTGGRSTGGKTTSAKVTGGDKSDSK